MSMPHPIFLDFYFPYLSDSWLLTLNLTKYNHTLPRSLTFCTLDACCKCYHGLGFVQNVNGIPHRPTCSLHRQKSKRGFHQQNSPNCSLLQKKMILIITLKNPSHISEKTTLLQKHVAPTYLILWAMSMTFLTKSDQFRLQIFKVPSVTVWTPKWDVTSTYCVKNVIDIAHKPLW